MQSKGRDFSIQTADGLKLYAKAWDVDGAIAHIHLVHGLGEHINRYEHLAAFYNSHNISLSGFDLRGHGQSDGKKGYTPTYNHYLDDAETFINQDKRDCPSIIYGHSMGGNIVLNLISRRNILANAAIITSPWIGLFKAPSAALMLGAKVMNFFGGFTDKNKLDPSLLATDPEVGKVYSSDPYVHDKIHSITGLEVINAGHYLLDNPFNCSFPLLLMHGKEDQITSYQASKKFSEKVNVKGTFKFWDGLYHEMHNGLKKEEVMNYCFEWLQKEL